MILSRLWNRACNYAGPHRISRASPVGLRSCRLFPEVSSGGYRAVSGLPAISEEIEIHPHIKPIGLIKRLSPRNDFSSTVAASQRACRNSVDVLVLDRRGAKMTIEIDLDSWEAGYADGRSGRLPQCPDNLDPFSYSSGYWEGRASVVVTANPVRRGRGSDRPRIRRARTESGGTKWPA